MLHGRQRIALAATVNKDNMKLIAEAYLDIPSTEIENLSIRHNDPKVFNVNILKFWEGQAGNIGPDQIQVIDTPLKTGIKA